MSVKIKPVGTIKARLGIQPGGEVHRFFTHTCAIHMDKYVPEDEGTLKNNIEEGIDYIKYNSPYAHYQYKGILYVDPETGSAYAKKDATKVPTGKHLTYHTPGTGHHWDERMKSAEMSQVIQEVQDYIRRR